MKRKYGDFPTDMLKAMYSDGVNDVRMAKEQFGEYNELYNERHKAKEQTWDEAYGDNKKAAEKAVKPIAQQIDEWDRSGRKRDVFFDYGSPSEAFSQAGISDEKIQLDASKVLKILKEHSEMQLDDFKKLDRIIKHPIIILESKNKDAGESYVVYGQASASNGKPIMISIRVGLKGGVSSIENVSKITSAYTRRNAQNLINTSVVKWVNPDKKRTTYWMYSFGLQLPSATPQSSSSTNSIPQKAKNVKYEDVKGYDSKSFGEKGVQERDSIAPDIVEKLVKENMPRAKAEKLVDGVIGRLYELGRKGEKYDKSYYEGVLTDKQAKQIYHAGVLDAKAAEKSIFHKDAHIIKDDNFKAAKISATDERLIQALCTFTGRNVRFKVLPKGVNAYIDASKGEIVINVSARRHVRTHVIHEAIHSLRMSNPGEYNKLSSAVAEIIFDVSTKNDFFNYRVIVANAYMNELKDENGVFKYGWEEKLKEETICDVFANVISNSDLIKKLGRENAKGLMRGVYAIQDFVSSVREKFSGNKDIPREAKVAYKLLASRAKALDKSFTESIKKAFPEGVERKRSAVADKSGDNSGVKKSVVLLDNGNTYVTASQKRNVITGNDRNQWRRQITDFFKELIPDGKSIDITTLEGDVLTISMSETANKARDDYQNVNGISVKLTDDEFSVKLRTEAHIDEIVETSLKDKNGKVPDTKSHSFAKEGFSYRTAYFQDYDGQYYKVRLSIGHNNNVATVYNVGKIQKDSIPSATKIVAVVGSQPLGKLSKGIIHDDGENVNSDSIKKSDTKFSLALPVETQNDLVAMHNASVEQLMQALSRGNMVMPSIAVTNKSFTDFGDVSLVFASDTINPDTDRLNKLYGADAWTPTQTRLKVNPKFDSTKTLDFVQRVKRAINNGSTHIFPENSIQFKKNIESAKGSIYDAYAENLGIQATYALENGIIADVPMKKNGVIDVEALRSSIDEVLNKDAQWRAYKKWLEGISNDIITSYDTPTQQDILESMAAQPDSAKVFNLSESGELTVPATEYKSINELRRNKGRLSENADAAAKQVGAQLISWAKNTSQSTGASIKGIIKAINVSFGARYGVSDIIESFKKSDIVLNNAQATALQELYQKAVELPTLYFEAKPKRSVGFGEIKLAVVPEGTDATFIEDLKNAGVGEVVTYEKGNKQSRVEAINSRPDVLFSLDLAAADKQIYDEIFAVDKKVAENFGNQIDKWLSGKMYSNEHFELGRTPAVLNALGAKSLPVFMNQDVIVKITGEKHNIALDDIKKIPEAISDPIMIFDSETVNNAFVILTELTDKAGDDIIVALHLNKKLDRININKIASIYGKYNAERFVEKQIENGNIRYFDKKKSQQWSTSKGLQLPKLVQSTTDNNSILEKADIVKMFNNKKYSKELNVIDIGDDIETSERKTEAAEADKALMTRQARIDRWRLGEGFSGKASDTGTKGVKSLSVCNACIDIALHKRKNLVNKTSTRLARKERFELSRRLPDLHP